MIVSPILASPTDIEKLTKRYILSPKIDGIRAITKETLVSRTFKPIKNNYIRKQLQFLPQNCDGELTAGNFQSTQSGIMRESGEPDFLYFLFDYVTDLEMPYEKRLELIRDMDLPDYVIPVTPWSIFNNIPMCIYADTVEKIKAYEKLCLDAGFEGIMARLVDAPYKCGRATAIEQYLIKIKRFEDSECVVLGFKEEMQNTNVATKDNFGRSKKSSHKENMIPNGTLGSFKVRDIYSDVEFDLPAKKGLKNADRLHFWEIRESLMGKIIKYVHFPKGVKIKPRHPQFLGFRDKDDIGNPEIKE